MASAALAPTSFFDRWSETYDSTRLQTTTYRPIHDAMIDRLRSNTPGRILDLGCGTGQLTERLAEHFSTAQVIGLDYSPGMLGEAVVRLGQHAPLTRADAQRLPLATGSVDVVTCSESFHWYPDQRLALSEIARVLRPGGRLLLASIATVTSAGDDVVRVVTTANGRPIKALPPHRLRRMLRGADFAVEHQRRIPRLGLIPWPVLTDARLRSE